eukprot:318440-Rhodomonas_salina.1
MEDGLEVISIANCSVNLDGAGKQMGTGRNSPTVPNLHASTPEPSHGQPVQFSSRRGGSASMSRQNSTGSLSLSRQASQNDVAELHQTEIVPSDLAAEFEQEARDEEWNGGPRGMSPHHMVSSTRKELRVQSLRIWNFSNVNQGRRASQCSLEAYYVQDDKTSQSAANIQKSALKSRGKTSGLFESFSSAAVIETPVKHVRFSVRKEKQQKSKSRKRQQIEHLLVDSQNRWVQGWELLFLAPLTYELWAFPFRLSMGDLSKGSVNYLVVSDIITDLVFVVDGIFQACIVEEMSSNLAEESATKTHARLAWKYLQTVFPFELLPSLPFWICYLVFAAASKPGAALWTFWCLSNALRSVLRTLRMRRYFKKMEVNLDINVDRIQYAPALTPASACRVSLLLLHACAASLRVPSAHVRSVECARCNAGGSRPCW